MCGEPLVADSNEDAGHCAPVARQQKVIATTTCVLSRLRSTETPVRIANPYMWQLRCKLSARCEDNIFHACRRVKRLLRFLRKTARSGRVWPTQWPRLHPVWDCSYIRKGAHQGRHKVSPHVLGHFFTRHFFVKLNDHPRSGFASPSSNGFGLYQICPRSSRK